MRSTLVARSGQEAGQCEFGLVNAQNEPAVNKDAAWLFQPKLAVTAAVEHVDALRSSGHLVRLN